MQDGLAFLGVQQSVTGKKWQQRSGSERLGLAIAQRLQLPEIVGVLLAGRGIAIDDAPGFLTPTLRDLLPDPLVIPGMDAGIVRVLGALCQQEKIAIFGDYDVDGATSASLLKRFFDALDVPVRLYIPDRMLEGYGLNFKAMQQLHQEGIRLVITVDCGTSSVEVIAKALEIGLATVVIDHHVADANLPQAAAVINPNRLDTPADIRQSYGQLAAVGVTFLFLVGLNRALRQQNFYQGSRSEPDLRQWLDIVALGTICDVVPLRGLNRAFVSQGLKIMAQQGNPGLKALMTVTALDQAPSAYHAGYVLGPRINAGGRIGTADLGVRLLSTNDFLEAQGIAEQLHRLNQERQELEQKAFEEALWMAKSQQLSQPTDILLVASPAWHQGIIGIIAGRLKEHFHRPVFVVNLQDQVAKGSGRSVQGLDLGTAVIAARQAGLVQAGGGHPMAAGFTADASDLDPLKVFLNQHLRQQARQVSYIPAMEIDGLLTAQALTPALYQQITQIGPFGNGNPEPRFAIADVRFLKTEIVAEKHVRCLAIGQDRKSFKAMAFRAASLPLGQLLLKPHALFHLAGTLRLNLWNDREDIQFIIEDAVISDRQG